MSLDYRYITTDAALQQCCEEASHCSYIALDTEFIRTRTYYAKLGLIQLYDGQTISLIDPFLIENWQPFCQLLSNQHITKIFHACSEDLALLWQQFAVIPTPIIDTQIVANFCHYPLSCAFAKLVAEKLQVTLDKSETRTNWLARPLSASQCHYAAADVYYLLPVAQHLLAECEELGWLAAVKEECQWLADKHQVAPLAEMAYQKINQAWQLTPRQLAILQRLTAWRLHYAQTKDLPINTVMDAEMLIKIARTAPTSRLRLDQLGLDPANIRRYGNDIVTLVMQALQLPEQSLPAKVIRIQEMQGYKTAVAEFKRALQTVSEQHHIANELIISRRYIDQLLRSLWLDNTPVPILLQGWRKVLVEPTLMPLLNKWRRES